MHESRLHQLWIAWIAEGESFQARWSNAPSNIDRSIRVAFHLRTGAAFPDAREYVQQMSRDAPVARQDGEAAIARQDRILIRSVGPGDTFCSVSYTCPSPPGSCRALKAFLRYNGAERIACVAIPNPRFNSLVLEGLSSERIATISIDTIAGAGAQSFFTGSPESNACMEDVVRAIVSEHATIS